jgi:ABC-type bacteriocin/lantibiotic exporter with double-glycine peptidase domain
MAFLDMIGVASILPFMAVLSNPGLIETNIILNTMLQALRIFGVENDQQFIFALGILVFILLISSLAFKAITTYALVRFSQMREHSISKRLVEGYLHQPYSWFLSRHSAELGKTILSEVEQVVGAGLRPMFDLIAKGMVSIALIVLLIVADPKLTLIVSFFFGGAYAFIFYFIKKYLKRIADERLKSNQLRFEIVSEAFNAVKEVKIGGLEQTYIKNFTYPSQIFAKTHAAAQVIGQLPKFILEAIAFGGILLIILYIMAQTGGFNNALPIVSLYVFAGYRLLPSLQQIYVAVTQLTFIRPALDKLYEEFKNLKKYNDNEDLDTLSLNKSIILNNISYNYPNSSRTALKDISLSIPAKSSVGIVGATGSGKTTTIDIILGLLQSQKGTLEIDGKIITEQNSRSWQRSIGYVPQHIYLSDDTVDANIAFGVDPKDIIQEDVEKASKIANLHEFITNELPKQYQTTIGARGVRLSGGQRQRIGIARALYHNPQVLVLDEATSALDNQTEKAVMNEVNNLNKDITIIIVAHRLSTVKKCDQIYFLKNGQLENQGTFEELIKVNEDFRANANN